MLAVIPKHKGTEKMRLNEKAAFPVQERMG
jgi:hypothetical protein